MMWFLPFPIGPVGPGLLDDGPDVTVEIDTLNPTHEISRKIFGTNPWAGDDDATIPDKIDRFEYLRLGGNRWSGYNWTNNASNAGHDWFHQNDGWLEPSDIPGQAVGKYARPAAIADVALHVTVPMLPYVAADKLGGGDIGETEDYLNVRCRQNYPDRASAPAGVPDNAIYQEDFVRWLLPEAPGLDLTFGLCNEPSLWDNTHPRLWITGEPTYAQLLERTVAWASMLKREAPNARVHGPHLFGWSAFEHFHEAPDANGRFFIDWYLSELAAQEAQTGTRLLDGLAIHWYSSARDADDVGIRDHQVTDNAVAARLQAPRSLWDPNFTESSWIAQWRTRGPIRLIPRMKEKIAANYPGTDLVFGEYSHGAESHISGGVAQADVLGIFATQDVYAATWWPLERPGEYGLIAFDLYLNYDGEGSRFAELSLPITVGDDEMVGAHAAIDRDRGRMTVMLINRRLEPTEVALNVGAESYDRIRAWRMDGDAPEIEALGEVLSTVELPPVSATMVEFSREWTGDALLAGYSDARFAAWIDGVYRPLGSLLPGWRLVGTADFDVDGADEILVSSDSRVGFWTVRGGRLTNWRAITGIPAGWQVLGARDLNFDGHADLVVWNPGDGRVGYGETDGRRVTRWHNLGVELAGRTPFALADADGDGDADLYAASNGEMGYFALDGERLAEWSPLGSIGSRVPVGVGDWNRDGVAEPLLHDVGTNRAEAWRDGEVVAVRDLDPGWTPIDGGRL